MVIPMRGVDKESGVRVRGKGGGEVDTVQAGEGGAMVVRVRAASGVMMAECIKMGGQGSSEEGSGRDIHGCNGVGGGKTVPGRDRCEVEISQDPDVGKSQGGGEDGVKEGGTGSGGGAGPICVDEVE